MRRPPFLVLFGLLATLVGPGSASPGFAQPGNAAVAAGQSGAGLVTVTMNARNEVKGVTIDPSLFNAEDVSVVEDLIVAAFSDAKGKAEGRAAEEMQKIAGGLNLPPGLNLPF